MELLVGFVGTDPRVRPKELGAGYQLLSGYKQCYCNALKIYCEFFSTISKKLLDRISLVNN